MSWAGRGSNDFVTNNDVLDAISTGVFTLQSGQSVSANNNFITKSEANTKLNITTITGTSTDWPRKAQFVSASTYYFMGVAYEGSSSVDSCSFGGYSFNFYTTTGTISIGDIIYYLSGGIYYPYVYTDFTFLSWSDDYAYWMELDYATGAIIDLGNC